MGNIASQIKEESELMASENWKKLLIANFLVFGASYIAISAARGEGIVSPSKWFKYKLTKELARDVNSTIHAFVQSYYGYILTKRLYSASSQEQYLGEMKGDMLFAGEFFQAYLVFDLIYSGLSLNFPIDFTIHHLLFLVVSHICRKYSFLKFPFAWLLVGEWSTIPLMLRTYLLNLNITGGPLLKIAEVCFAILFFFCRVILYGAGLAHMMMNKDIILPPPHPSCYFVLALVCGGYCLNLAWFRKILYKAFVQKAKKS